MAAPTSSKNTNNNTEIQANDNHIVDLSNTNLTGTTFAAFLNAALGNFLYRIQDNYPNKYSVAFEDVGAAIANLAGRLAIVVTDENSDYVFGVIKEPLYKSLKKLLYWVKTLPYTASTDTDVMSLPQLKVNITLMLQFLKHIKCKRVKPCKEKDLKLVLHATKLFVTAVDGLQL